WRVVVFYVANLTEVYALPLHDALPISFWAVRSSSSMWPSLERDGSWIGLRSWPATMPTRSPFFCARKQIMPAARIIASRLEGPSDRKGTRLNSSHVSISYAVSWLEETG